MTLTFFIPLCSFSIPPENETFSDVFRGYRNTPTTRNGLIGVSGVFKTLSNFYDGTFHEKLHLRRITGF